MVSSGVKYITKKSLLVSWKHVRKELSRASNRDVIDYIEYDINPDKWIDQLLRQIATGTYEPSTPHRFSIAKSKGFCRRMTMLSIPDLVLYRAIVEYIYDKKRRYEHKHVYFERNELSHAQTDAGRDARRKPNDADPFWGQFLEDMVDYETGSKKRFRAWLHYDQYRKHLLFKRVYKYIVVTDITNFFDSILFSRISDSLCNISLSTEMQDILFLILERLGKRRGLKESPHVGIPVDEFDCSRHLAHMALFPHDERMVKKVGEDAYIRWMDDQNFGVRTYPEALQVLKSVDESLAELHLTPHSGKSKILKIGEARRHFHLDINGYLDQLEETVKKDSVTNTRKKLKEIWSKSKKHDGNGEWEKVLKRFYRFSGYAKVKMFRKRSLNDIIRYPRLTRRILDYMRCVSSPNEYLDFIRKLYNHPDQIYGDINRLAFESLLRLEPDYSESQGIRKIASDLLQGNLDIAGKEECACVAPLLILRYGDKRSLPTLYKQFKNRDSSKNDEIARACAIVYASYGSEYFSKVRKRAGTIFKNYMSYMILMVDAVKQYTQVPSRFNDRIRESYDSVTMKSYIDMRTILAVRLLGLNKKMAVKRWLNNKKSTFVKKEISVYEKQLINKLWSV